MAGGLAGVLMRGSTLQDCYNRGPVTGALVSGLTSGAYENSNVLHSYNAGPVKGSGLPKQEEYFTGAHFSSPTVPGPSGGASRVEGCYYNQQLFNDAEAASESMGEGLPPDVMRLSDDLNYWLNEGRGVWSRQAGVNEGLPCALGRRGGSDEADQYSSWREVGKSLAENPTDFEGLRLKLAADGVTYEIGTPRELAWFAYMVNTDPAGYASKNVRLTADLDMGRLDERKHGVGTHRLQRGRALYGRVRRRRLCDQRPGRGEQLYRGWLPARCAAPCKSRPTLRRWNGQTPGADRLHAGRRGEEPDDAGQQSAGVRRSWAAGGPCPRHRV